MDLAIALVGVGGTLFGVAFGGFVGYKSQKVAYERESDERLGADRRRAYLEFLSCAHVMYDRIRTIHRRHRAGSLALDDARRELADIPSAEAQTSLEALRLVATDRVASAAAGIWTQIRRTDIPLGRSFDREAWAEWSNLYWGARRDFIDAARADIGFAALDWRTAGAGPETRRNRGAPG